MHKLDFKSNMGYFYISSVCSGFY